jgi:SAM-dependent methyltransferase
MSRIFVGNNKKFAYYCLTYGVNTIMNPSLPHTNKVEKIRADYDSTAEFYDARYKYIQYLKYSFLLPSLIDREVLPEVRIKGPILDSGGGTGLFLEFIDEFSLFLQGRESDDERVNALYEFTRFNLRESLKCYVIPTPRMCRVMVICDISYEMLRIASQNLQSSRNHGLVACDSTYLPFRDGIFSNAVAFTVFQNIDDVEHAIEEAYRILLDGGVLTTSLLKKTSNKLKFAMQLGKYFQEVSPIYVDRIVEEFQKLIVQSDKYSPFYNLEKVEDYFLTAKKNSGTKNETICV